MKFVTVWQILYSQLPLPPFYLSSHTQPPTEGRRNWWVTSSRQLRELWPDEKGKPSQVHNMPLLCRLWHSGMNLSSTLMSCYLCVTTYCTLHCIHNDLCHHSHYPRHACTARVRWLGLCVCYLTAHASVSLSLSLYIPLLGHIFVTIMSSQEP